MTRKENRDISTHSLTKRLTRRECRSCRNTNISTHSLTKRLTLKQIRPEAYEHISTHSLTKRLTCWKECYQSGIGISTHSLTKRLTVTFQNIYIYIEISTHSLTKRLTGSIEYGFKFLQTFQLTASRRGWRPCTMVAVCDHWHFNSQPHEEADMCISSSTLYEWKFQLTASRRGWRIIIYDTIDFFFISTHSLTKRLTIHQTNSPTGTSISTHSLTKRLTFCGYLAKSVQNPFQLTASRRGWPSLDGSYSRQVYFNSQPHEEADRWKRWSRWRD